MKDHTPHLDRSAWIERIAARTSAASAKYFAMYSSFAGGIVTDPALMLVPADDHVVHRGDGVFESMKCVDGGIYNLREHLKRLIYSAEGIQLKSPVSRDALEQIIVETVRAGKQPNAQIRVLLTRGPGSLGVNPLDSPEPQLYVIIAKAGRPFMESHPNGARIGFSRHPPKPSPFASLKTCNYLPNALLAHEGATRGYDFMIAVTQDGHILEGPTENIAIIAEGGRLVSPDAPDVLSGTTLKRVIALLNPLIADQALEGVDRRRIHRDDFARAREVLIFGTTHDIVSVTHIEDAPVGTGAPGPVYTRLAPLLRTDIRTNEAMRTQVF